MPSHREDPLLVRARREALCVGVIWLAAMTYTVGCAAWLGYPADSSAPVRLVLGFPDWVFWGIVVPWVACVVGGVWFSYGYMSNDDVADGETISEDN
ncbi:MAG: hypothetical protein AB7F89_07730 [Pirellulaceae bacterium]